MRNTLGIVIAALLVLAGVQAYAGNKVVYVQGRGWKDWKSDKAALTNFSNVELAFNGNAKINGSETNSTVRNAIAANCSGGNSCVLHCYSAGCLRVLKAISDLRASGNTLPGLMWIEGSGSSAGGTELAELSTSGFTSLIAKLIGQHEKVDDDLIPSVARGTWGYVQDDAGATFYLVAGRKDLCKKLLFFKICGGKYLPGRDDGVVPFHSSCGYAQVGSYTDGCGGGKYPYHTYDTAYAACGGENVDHFGIVGIGNKAIDGRGHDTSPWGDSTVQSDCAASSCDDPFQDTSTDFSKTPSGASVAGNVDNVTSNATGNTAAGMCAGKCGGYGGNSCWCDTACSSFGDCCSDYSAACSNFQN